MEELMWRGGRPTFEKHKTLFFSGGAELGCWVQRGEGGGLEEKARRVFFFAVTRIAAVRSDRCFRSRVRSYRVTHFVYARCQYHEAFVHDEEETRWNEPRCSWHKQKLALSRGLSTWRAKVLSKCNAECKWGEPHKLLQDLAEGRSIPNVLV